MRSVGLIALTMVASACAGQAADHESLGDRAYAELDFAGALIEYRLGIAQDPSNDGLRTKAGAAALRAEDLLAAAEEYAAIVGRDHDNAGAMEGLDRVAAGALNEGNREALNLAIGALLEVDEDRVFAKYAGEIAADIGPSTPPDRAMRILPAAAAVATDSRVQDSLIYEYARILVRRNDCERGATVFEALVRRRRNAAIAEKASRDLARCTLQAGRRALLRGRPQEAIAWFERAIVGGGESPATLAAYLGLGDAMFSRGDFVGAAGAYVSVVDRTTPGDSLHRQAIEKLNLIGDAGTEEDKKEF